MAWRLPHLSKIPANNEDRSGSYVGAPEGISENLPFGWLDYASFQEVVLILYFPTPSKDKKFLPAFLDGETSPFVTAKEFSPRHGRLLLWKLE
jgi:hypothetical protein